MVLAIRRCFGILTNSDGFVAKAYDYAKGISRQSIWSARTP